eukprot:TRINITY_DN16438_c1_g1_i1.p4 TRINITY_DN16438_c1_g1~~TRINITY_DN16438_c1_g1_i1.p4  ORF type:complete len:168 (+),score=6.11 TRINITY_DN16438_c1_g1_i1:510-1013(+)
MCLYNEILLFVYFCKEKYFSGLFLRNINFLVIFDVTFILFNKSKFFFFLVLECRDWICLQNKVRVFFPCRIFVALDSLETHFPMQSPRSIDLPHLYKNLSATFSEHAPNCKTESISKEKKNSKTHTRRVTMILLVFKTFDIEFQGVVKSNPYNSLRSNLYQNYQLAK